MIKTILKFVGRKTYKTATKLAKKRIYNNDIQKRISDLEQGNLDFSANLTTKTIFK